MFRDFRLPLLDILEKSWMTGYYAQISSGLQSLIFIVSVIR